MVKDALQIMVKPRTLMFQIIVIFFVASLAITVTLSAFFIRNTSSMIMDNNSKYMDIYSKIISDNIDSYINEMDRTARILLGNAGIQEIMERHNRGVDSLQMVRDIEQMQNSVWSFTSLRDNYRIIIADAKGDLYYKDSWIYSISNSNILEDTTILDNREVLGRGDFLLLPTYQTNYTLLNDRPVFVLVRELKNLSGDRTIAYTLVLFDMEAFIRRLAESLPYDLLVEAMVRNADDEVVLSLDRAMIGQATPAEASDHRYYSYTSPLTGWTTRLSTPVQQAMTPTNVALGFFLPLAVMVLAGSIMIATFMFAYVLTPIRRLVAAMRAVKGGNLAPMLKGNAHSTDIATLYDGFNRMMAEISDLTEAVVQERMMLNNAQMTALRYQISPHFFNNTLQTVEAIAEVHGVREIQVIATSLGNMLRYNISDKGGALLSEELDHVDTYLKIEQIRFRNRLIYRIEAPADVRWCAVPRFILQPLAENCIVHGGRGVTELLEVDIRAEIREEELVVTIVNSGPPIAEERLEEIRRRLDEISREDRVAAGESIGIYNPHRRIVKRYGLQYGITFLYSDDRGTCVRLIMPARDSL